MLSQAQPLHSFCITSCGWGTLVAFAAKNYGCDVTGVTVAKTGAAFGTQRIKDNGVSSDKARILCTDYRFIPTDRKFTKIVSLEMAEVHCFSCVYCTLRLVNGISSMWVFVAMAHSCGRCMTFWMTMEYSSFKSLA